MTKKLRVILFLVIFMFLGVAFVVNMFFVRKVVERDTISSWEIHNERNKKRIEEYLNQINNISLAFASNDIYKKFLKTRSKNIEQDINNIFLSSMPKIPLIQAMRVISEDGDILIYVKDGKTIVNQDGYINISSKEYFHFLRSSTTRDPLFSNIERALTPGDAEFGPPLIRVLVPLYDKDKKLGYLLINFDVSALNDFLYAGQKNDAFSFIAGYAPEYSGIFLFHQKHVEYEFANQLGSNYFVSTVYTKQFDETLKNNNKGVINMAGRGFAVFSTISPRNYNDAAWKMVYIVPKIEGNLSLRDFLNDKFILFILVFLAALWVLVPYFVSKGTVEPINKLREGIEKIGSGQFSFRFDVNKFHPELRSIAATVNSMASSISTYLDKIENDNKKIGILTKMQTMGLIAGGMAHELSSPLNSILLVCDILMENASESQKEDITLIMTEAEKCIRIIASLRAMAPKNKPNMVFIKTNLKDMVFSVIDIHTKDVIFDCSDAFIACDPVLMKTVIKNLYKNAVEATRENRQITFRTYTKNNASFLEIEDNGCGIDDNILSKFPAPFCSTKKVGSNMGVGVCLIYNITSDHEGTVSVESQVGKGTKFILRFKSYAENNAS